MGGARVATGKARALRRYQRIGIAEYWLVNLDGPRITRHVRQRAAFGASVYEVGQSFESELLPGLVIDVSIVTGA